MRDAICRIGGVEFMKMGIRKPSIKKSISAKTTGKMKRSVKKAINPLYGKKGMGVIHSPSKAMYNAVYGKTTVPIIKHSKSKTSRQTNCAANKYLQSQERIESKESQTIPEIVQNSQTSIRFYVLGIIAWCFVIYGLVSGFKFLPILIGFVILTISNFVLKE